MIGIRLSAVRTTRRSLGRSDDQALAALSAAKICAYAGAIGFLVLAGRTFRAGRSVRMSELRAKNQEAASRSGKTKWKKNSFRVRRAFHPPRVMAMINETYRCAGGPEIDCNHCRECLRRINLFPRGRSKKAGQERSIAAMLCGKHLKGMTMLRYRRGPSDRYPIEPSPARQPS